MADIRLSVAWRSAVWTLAIVPPVVYAVLLASRSPFESGAVDWQSYVVGTERLLAGQSPYSAWQLAGPYSFGSVAGGNGFIYPPSAAILMAPFLKPFALWSLMNVGLYVGGVFAVLRRDRHSAVVSGLLLWAALAPGWLIDGLRAGAVSSGIAGLLGLIYAGAPLSGIAGGLKGFPIVWFALDARPSLRRAVIGLAVCLGIPVAVAVILAGIGPWFDFLKAFSNAQPACDLAPVSLVCAGVPRVVLLAGGVVLAGLSLWLPRPIGLLAAGAGLVLAAPEVWDHYWTTIVPGSVACAAAAMRSFGQLVKKRWGLRVLAGVSNDV